jgi:outer membrane protein TolC
MTKQTLASLREVRLLLDKLSHSVQARYETNQASLQDLLKVQIERSTIDIEIVELEQREHLAQAHLSHLLNQPLETGYAIPEAQSRQPIAVSLPELERSALRMRPELLAFGIGIKRAKVSRLLTVTSWLPDVTGRIESRQFKGEGGIREHDTFIGVTVPVWSLLKGVGGEWRSANREVQEAEALYTEMKNEVLLAVHQAYAKVKSSEYAFDTYKHFILPQTEQQVEVALAAYEAGRTDFLDLIDAQRMLRDAQIAYYKIRADYDMGFSDLRLAVGGDFQNVGTVNPSKGAVP